MLYKPKGEEVEKECVRKFWARRQTWARVSQQSQFRTVHRANDVSVGECTLQVTGRKPPKEASTAIREFAKPRE